MFRALGGTGPRWGTEDAEGGQGCLRRSLDLTRGSREDPKVFKHRGDRIATWTVCVCERARVREPGEGWAGAAPCDLPESSLLPFITH